MWAGEYTVVLQEPAVAPGVGRRSLPAVPAAMAMAQIEMQGDITHERYDPHGQLR